jgi:hypothetical protein
LCFFRVLHLLYFERMCHTSYLWAYMFKWTYHLLHVSTRVRSLKGAIACGQGYDKEGYSLLFTPLRDRFDYSYLCFKCAFFIKKNQSSQMSIHVNTVMDEIHCEIGTLSPMCLFKHGKLHWLSWLVHVVLIHATPAAK